MASVVVVALVLAGGSGERFGGPKQFEPLVPGERLVDRAISEIHGVSNHIVLVLPPDVAWDGQPVDLIVPAGTDRLGSVRNGLNTIIELVEDLLARDETESPDDVIVLITDAAHPLASAALARAVVDKMAQGFDAVTPFLETVDVVKSLSEDGEQQQTVGRSGIGVSQMPAAFRLGSLRRAHDHHVRHPDLPAWEDTQLIEAIGGSVGVVPGDPANIHVTEPKSLWMVQAMAAAANPPPV